MKKCPKCGKELLDDMMICGYCGASLEPTGSSEPMMGKEIEKSLEDESDSETVLKKIDGAPDIKKEPSASSVTTKKSSKKLLIVGLVGVIAVAGIGGYLYMNSDAVKYSNAKKKMDSGDYVAAYDQFQEMDPTYKDIGDLIIKCAYEAGISAYNNEDYETAAKYFEEAEGYGDAGDRYNESIYLVEAKNDKEAPVLSEGLHEGDDFSIYVTTTDFNPKEHIDGLVQLSDNITPTENLKTEVTSVDGIIGEDGIVDTTVEAKTYSCNYIVTDDAGNELSIPFTITIKNVINITKEHPSQVLYDGEYGKVTLKGIKHGYQRGSDGYVFEFDIDNKSNDENLCACISDVSINDYEVDSYHNIESVSPGKKGSMESTIHDEDIPKKAGKFDKIECTFYLQTNAMFGKTLFQAPLIIDLDAISEI